jgi:hypothetical protein
MKYKVWDPLGRLLSASINPCEAVITSLAWAPGLASSNTSAGGDVLSTGSSSSSSSSGSSGGSASSSSTINGNIGTNCAYSGASSGVSPVNERFLVGCYGSLRVVDGSSGMTTHLITATPASSIAAASSSSSAAASAASDSKAGDASDSKVGGGSRRGVSLGRSALSAPLAAGHDAPSSSSSASSSATPSVSEEAIEAALGPQLPPFCGSITAIAWNNDGSLCGIGTGNGNVVVASPVNIGCSTPEGTFTVTLAGPKLLKAVDVGVISSSSSTSGTSSSTSETVASSSSSLSGIDIECRDRITGFSLGHGHLLVLSPSHLAIYTGAHSASQQSATNATPMANVISGGSSSSGGATTAITASHSLDNLKSPIRFVSQAPRHFVAIDAAGVISIYSYDGRLLCQPKPHTNTPIRVESLSSNLVSIGHDCLAICDRTEGVGSGVGAGAAGAMIPAGGVASGGVGGAAGGGRVVRLWDIKSGGGRALPAPVVHHQGINFIQLSNGTVPTITPASTGADNKEKGGAAASAATSTNLGGGSSSSMIGGIPAGGLADRRLFLIDASADGYLTPILKPSLSKIATMVDSGAWNTNCDTLTLLTDGSVVTWLAPTAATAASSSTAPGAAVASPATGSGGAGMMIADGTGMDLASRAKVKADPSVAALFAGTAGGLASSIGVAGLGSGGGNNAAATILCHSGSRLTVRRADGSVVHAKASAFSQILHECVASNKWKEALRLARFVKAESLWAALAALALSGPRPHLETAEAALAAIKAVDKLSWVSYVRSLPLPERRNAEMASYRRQFDEAESILLQATPPLLYRALKLNIRIHRWERAMQLALQHAQAVASGRAGPNAVPFVDLVLWYRAKYNESIKRCVTNCELWVF